MRPLRSKTLVYVIVPVALAVTALPVWQSWQDRPPEFARYPAGEARKEAFFTFLGPLVDEENGRWLRDRERLERLGAALAAGESPGKRDRVWIDAQAAFFNLDRDLPIADQIQALLPHVDEVPRSLALAQAAKESAWGTSRFATDGHNYFGQRCYDEDCGLVPKSRRRGARFEVRRFKSPRASVASYMNNINSHPEYEVFRDYRARQRVAGKRLNGIQAAEYLMQYSERRQAYVDEIQSLIRFNRLDRPKEATPEQPTGHSAETTAL